MRTKKKFKNVMMNPEQYKQMKADKQQKKRKRKKNK